ncbi:hypothetical protein C0J52_17526 [Blattella germanica]|nr:hypothetical protein C0J52_17526 [Blattella germanica]
MRDWNMFLLTFVLFFPKCYAYPLKFWGLLERPSIPIVGAYVVLLKMVPRIIIRNVSLLYQMLQKTMTKDISKD